MERECTLFKLESKAVIDKSMINSRLRGLKVLKTQVFYWFSHEFFTFNYSLFALLVMMIVFSFENCMSAVELFNGKQPNHLMRECHLGK